MIKPIESYIDHTLLRVDTTKEDVIKLCKQAEEKKFAAVCIPPYLVDVARKVLGDKSDVAIATVIGFPLGYNELTVKINECKSTMDDGADELDVVVNISAVKSNDWDLVRAEIDSIATTISMKDKVVKLILETGIMTDDEISKLCKLCIEYNVDFAKTSTGFNGSGATLEKVRFMKSILGNKVKIKASGGIKSAETAWAMIEAGASRIGTSSAMQF